jgi:signal transduction histidine kinase
MTASRICELLLQQSPGCTWLLNRSGEFQTVYGNAARVFGRGAAELTGLHFPDLFPAPVRPCWMQRIGRVFAGETLSSGARFGAAAATYSITLFPVRGPEGGIVFAAGMAQELADRDLLLSLWRARENDRARVAQLLHDHVGQLLSAAGLQLDLLRMDLAEGAFPISQRTAEIQGMLETVMKLVRELSQELNPAVAERIGLRAALDRLAGRLRSEFQGTVRVLADPAAQPSAAAAAALYRIAQEAGLNAVRHSGCSAVEILLKSFRSGAGLEIRDNGSGFDPAGGALPQRGLGLLAMEQCAEQAGIDLQIVSSPGKGTVVTAFCRPAETAGSG